MLLKIIPKYSQFNSTATKRINQNLYFHTIKFYKKYNSKKIYFVIIIVTYTDDSIISYFHKILFNHIIFLCLNRFVHTDIQL